MLANQMSERRTNRSSYASQALQLQLLQVAEQFCLDAVVLSDSLGHVWAASCRSPEEGGLVSELASMGRSSSAPKQRVRRGRSSVMVRRLQVGPATLFLAAQGAERRSGPALERATDGVERILGDLL
jgi:hypothetical protein